MECRFSQEVPVTSREVPALAKTGVPCGWDRACRLLFQFGKDRWIPLVVARTLLEKQRIARTITEDERRLIDGRHMVNEGITLSDEADF